MSLVLADFIASGENPMDDAFRVTTKEHEGIPVVVAHGEIDIASAPILEAELVSIPDDVPTLVIDLSGVTFLDSSGLKVLVAALKRLRTGATSGSVRLVVTRPIIQTVFEVTALDSLFEIYASLDKALGR
jgi:anti-sigma B factor antagonist